MKKKLMVAIVFSLIAALVLSTVAYAITISVDGTKEAAWDSGDGSGQVPGQALDDGGNESGITNGYDIQYIYWTNDSTYMYFLVQTYANIIMTGNPVPTIVFCLDTDNNTATGGSYSNCNSMTGIDRSIVITRFGIEVYDGDPNTGTLLGGATASRAYATTYLEARVDLVSLGLDTGTVCTQNIQGAVYFDNGISDPDDATPGSGTMTIGCGSPTAITLTSIDAASNPPGLGTPELVGLLVISTVLVAGAGLVIFRRRKA